MTRLYLVVGLAVVTLGVLVFELVRRRMLKERHAAIWLLFTALVALGAVFPGAVTRFSQFLGFTVPANLVLVLGLIVLTAITIQLSVELGRLRDLVERLASQASLLEARSEPKEESMTPLADGEQEHQRSDS
jgi:hypothetical protein